MYNRSSIAVLSVVAAFATVLAGCVPGDAGPTGDSETQIGLSLGAGTLTLAVGETVSVHAQISVKDATKFYALEYTSDAPAVVLASNDGTIEGVGPGSATVKATATLLDSGAMATATLKITVTGDATDAGTQSDAGTPADAGPPSDAGTTAIAGPTFPRIFGMNVGAKNYDDAVYQAALAKADVVILGFYKGWRGDVAGSKIKPTVQAIKALNPSLLVGQYTVLNETSTNTDPNTNASADVAVKVNQENWWARNAAGAMQQWTSAYGAFDINFTNYAKVDANGQRFSQWMADRSNNVYFKNVPEFRIWYFDNVMRQARVTADWNKDGTNDAAGDPTFAAAYRAGHKAEWDRARAIQPGLLLIGNVDSDLSQPEFKNQLDGAFMEGAMGTSYAIEKQGWSVMMTRYRNLMANTRAPHLVALNVHLPVTDYQNMRYGLTSTLMDDGYYSFTDSAVEYSSLPSFDEFKVNLGYAVDAPQAVAWKSGVFMRRFEHGMALVNPTATAVTVAIPAGYKHFSGAQVPSINNGAAVTSITLAAKDGVVLVTQ